MNFIEYLETCGWAAAIRGMRNPKNSWSKSDSYFDTNGSFILGPNDLDLAKRLIAAGPEHRKFLRMIHIQFDLIAPRYIWSEFDTYHYNTKNSCSTMHKLLDKNTPITRDMFYVTPFNDMASNSLDSIIDILNYLRIKYNNASGKDKLNIIEEAKAILPESFLQRRTIDTNYEEIFNIIHQRQNHRLHFWHIICDYFKANIPYFDEFWNALKNTKKD